MPVTMDDIHAPSALDRMESLGITFEKIVKELQATAFSNLKDYFNVVEGGELQLKPWDNVTKKKVSAIKKVKEKTVITESKDGEKIYRTSTVELEMHDKQAALWRLIELRGDKPAEKVDMNVRPLVILDE